MSIDTLENMKDNSRAEANLVEMVKKLYGEAGGELPVAKSRMEVLLQAVYEKLGSGSADPSAIRDIVYEWFEDHPEAVGSGFDVEIVDNSIVFVNKED